MQFQSLNGNPGPRGQGEEMPKVWQRVTPPKGLHRGEVGREASSGDGIKQGSAAICPGPKFNYGAVDASYTLVDCINYLFNGDRHPVDAGDFGTSGSASRTVTGGQRRREFPGENCGHSDEGPPDQQYPCVFIGEIVGGLTGLRSDPLLEECLRREGVERGRGDPRGVGWWK